MKLKINIKGSEPTAVLEQQLVGTVSVHLSERRKGSSLRWYAPADRQEACRSIIGDSDYTVLENLHASRLDSKDSNEVSESISFLSKALVSLRHKAKISSLLGDNLRKLDDSKKGSPDPAVLFAAAEGLCYLGDAKGLPVLESALSSPRTTPAMKRRALEAVANLQNKDLTIRLAKEQLTSDEALVSYAAFDILETIYGDDPKELFSQAAQKFNQLVEKARSSDALTSAESVLLLATSTLLRTAIRQNGLAAGQKASIKKGAADILSSRPANEANRVASLFAELATDQDLPLVRKMFESEDKRIQAAGILALAKCSKNTQKPFTSELVKLLDDRDDTVRNFALCSLRIQRNEKAGNFLSEQEFQREKARVKELLAK
jgi:hypothetical protein